MKKLTSRKLWIFVLNYVTAIVMLKFHLISVEEWVFVSTSISGIYMGTNTLAKFAYKPK